MNFFVTGQTKNISYPVDGFLTFEEWKKHERNSYKSK
jgi:hypothetical protein